MCSLEDLKGILSEMSFEDDLSMEDPEFAHDEAIEVQVAGAAEEFARRSALVGGGYPFSFDGAVLTVSGAWSKEATPYVFLLLLSAVGLPRQRRGPRLFEELVTAALRGYLAGESLRFGFPHREPVPSHPNDAVTYLARRIDEPRIFLREVRSREKDMGVDAVGWKSFHDGLRSQVVLLANCSTGADWKSKLGEPSIDKWRQDD